MMISEDRKGKGEERGVGTRARKIYMGKNGGKNGEELVGEVRVRSLHEF